jgi:hypothetical protein
MGRPRSYDWERWFRRLRVTLVRGRHYHCSHSSFAQQIRNAAFARHLSVSVEDKGDRFVVRVLEPQPVEV